MLSVVTVTLNPAIDGSAEAAHVVPVRKVRTTNERYDPGGGGINVARVVHRLGGDVVALYLAGGATGGVLDGLHDREGVARFRVDIAGHTRISQAVFDRATGQEYRFVPAGPLVSRAELARALQWIARLRCDFLVLSGSLPRGAPDDFHARIMRKMDSKTRIVLDTSGRALKAAIEAGGIFLAKPSRGEFEQLAGKSFTGIADLGREMQRFVKRRKVAHLAVTLGHEGALLASASGVVHLPPIDLEARSAVGAGDSFVGGMVTSLTRDDPVETAFRYGLAAGSASVLNPGTGLCLKEDVERLFVGIGPAL